MATVTVSQLAVELGISGGRIRVLIARGIFDSAITEKPKTRTGPYKLDLAVAKECVSKYLSVHRDGQVKAGRGGGTGKLSDRDKLLQAQIRKEVAIAKLRENELQRRAGAFILRTDMNAQLFLIARSLRDAFLQVPDRMAAILSSESDESKVHELLTLEIESVLTGLQSLKGVGHGN